MASRKEQKERLKAERLERERQAQAAQRRKRLVGYGAGGALAIAAVAAIVVAIAAGGSGGSGPEQAGESGDFPEGSAPPVEIADLGEAVDAAGCRLQQHEEEGRQHVPEGTDVDYGTNPPTSGDHFAVPAEDGAYTDAPATEALVHSLEHGRIIIQYQDGVPDSVRGDLKALFDEDPYHVILTLNETGMPFEVAATAWTRTLGCPEMNEQAFDAIRAFRDEFRDEGPEFVP